jgi:antitoxin MazE
MLQERTVARDLESAEKGFQIRSRKINALCFPSFRPCLHPSEATVPLPPLDQYRNYVIPMLLQMKVAVHRIGNSQGVILPKALLAQVGFTGNELEMIIERDAIVLRRPRKSVRAGWAGAAKRLARSGDDVLVWPEFANEADNSLKW